MTSATSVHSPTSGHSATSVHSAVEPAETPLTPESWGKLGMWVFLVGDAVGFGTLLAAYGGMRATSGDWPTPYDVLGINLTAFMTFLLICSSVTMVKALEWLGRGDRTRCRGFLFFTALGGAIFVGLQAYEWSKLIHEGLHINGLTGELLDKILAGGASSASTLFGTSFFIITGFHGLHVTGGVLYLLAMIRYVTHRPLPAASYNAVEITGLYWHFVDLVWIMVFTFMYLL
jgi:cytochrome c oxidase subunit III